MVGPATLEAHAQVAPGQPTPAAMQGSAVCKPACSLGTLLVSVLGPSAATTASTAACGTVAERWSCSRKQTGQETGMRGRDKGRRQTRGGPTCSRCSCSCSAAEPSSQPQKPPLGGASGIGSMGCGRGRTKACRHPSNMHRVVYEAGSCGIQGLGGSEGSEHRAAVLGCLSPDQWEWAKQSKPGSWLQYSRAGSRSVPA